MERHPRGSPEAVMAVGQDSLLSMGSTARLVTIRHNDVHDEWAHLCGLPLTSSHVTTKPLINYGDDLRAPQGQATRRGNDTTLGEEMRGDVSAHGFWQLGRSTIFDICITDTDSKSYENTASDKLLECFAQQKQDKYEEACLERRKDFTPLCYSVDGMAYKAARAAERHLASLLAIKWDRQYSKMVNFIRTRMSVAVVRSNTMLLRRQRANSWHCQAPEDGAAVGPTNSHTVNTHEYPHLTKPTPQHRNPTHQNIGPDVKHKLNGWYTDK